MCWRAGWGTEVFERLRARGPAAFRVVHRFDHWLEMNVHSAVLLQDEFPGAFVDFVGDCGAGTLDPPAGAM